MFKVPVFRFDASEQTLVDADNLIFWSFLAAARPIS